MFDKSHFDSEFNKVFKENPKDYFISFGRLEICGNHTDHNNGKCLVATCDLPIKAACSLDSTGLIDIYSKGFGRFSFNINDLTNNPKEKGTSLSIVKGVCFFSKFFGYNIGGFKAYIESEVLPGAGVSSSAAFELLIAEIISFYFNKDKISKIKKAIISQKAEREYFGKPCGLLDQIGASFGGINYIDFKNLNNIKVKNIGFPFDFDIYLINTGGSHENLTDLYAAIPYDMKEAARKVGNKKVLRQISYSNFLKKCKSLGKEIKEIEYSRAIHYYEENKRVVNAFKACKKNKEEDFLKNIKESGLSSCNLLKNAMVYGEYEESPKKAIDLINTNFPNNACKVHGGGFKGTVICFVKKQDKDKFEINMSKVFGKTNLIKVNISPIGASHFVFENKNLL